MYVCLCVCVYGIRMHILIKNYLYETYPYGCDAKLKPLLSFKLSLVVEFSKLIVFLSFLFFFLFFVCFYLVIVLYS